MDQSRLSRTLSSQDSFKKSFGHKTEVNDRFQAVENESGTWLKCPDPLDCILRLIVVLRAGSGLQKGTTNIQVEPINDP